MFLPNQSKTEQFIIAWLNSYIIFCLKYIISKQNTCCLKNVIFSDQQSILFTIYTRFCYISSSIAQLFEHTVV